jgi:hypothetical protein
MYVVITSLEKSVSYESCMSTFDTSTSYVCCNHKSGWICILWEAIHAAAPVFIGKLPGQGTRQERNSEEWRNRIYSTRRRLKGAQDNRKRGGRDERIFFLKGKTLKGEKSEGIPCISIFALGWGRGIAYAELLVNMNLRPAHLVFPPFELMSSCSGALSSNQRAS